MTYTRTKNTTEINIDDVVLTGVLKILDKNNQYFGTMTDLSLDLIKSLGKTAVLPRSPSALRIVLNRVVNRLRSRGVSVKFGRTNDHNRTRFVKLVTNR